MQHLPTLFVQRNIYLCGVGFLLLLSELSLPNEPIHMKPNNRNVFDILGASFVYSNALC